MLSFANKHGGEGLNSNQRFRQSPLVVAQNIGQATITYANNVYKYYVAYKLALAAGAQEHSQ